MQERKVTVGGVDYPLAPPFFVLATQNPIEQEGTYPLPEAQLDRFMFNILIDYPNAEEEKAIIKQTTLPQTNGQVQKLEKVDFPWIQKIVRGVPVSDHVVDYASRLVRATRSNHAESPDFIREWVSWGAGPRAGQYLILGAKTRAALRGEFNVSCDDIRAVARPVLRHRIVPNFTAESEGINANDIIQRLLDIISEASDREYA
jgi:MoxR-like ATPase